MVAILRIESQSDSKNTQNKRKTAIEWIPTFSPWLIRAGSFCSDRTQYKKATIAKKRRKKKKETDPNRLASRKKKLLHDMHNFHNTWKQMVGH